MNNDVQMIEELQVAREMLQAIKTLQRALEREVEEGVSGSLGSSRAGTAGVVMSPGVLRIIGLRCRRLTRWWASMHVVETHEASGLERGKTIASAESRESGTAESLTASGSRSGSASDGRVRDTLDREFIESVVDALRRVSNGPDIALPSWMITK
jgi:hypothetical protein